VAETLASNFKSIHGDVQIRHRETKRPTPDDKQQA
jgi:hypothetical protein